MSNFFQQLKEFGFLDEGVTFHMTAVIKDGIVTTSARFSSKKNSELKPVIVTGSIEEMDNGLLQLVSDNLAPAIPIVNPKLQVANAAEVADSVKEVAENKPKATTKSKAAAKPAVAAKKEDPKPEAPVRKPEHQAMFDRAVEYHKNKRWGDSIRALQSLITKDKKNKDEYESLLDKVRKDKFADEENGSNNTEAKATSSAPVANDVVEEEVVEETDEEIAEQVEKEISEDNEIEETTDEVEEEIVPEPGSPNAEVAAEEEEIIEEEEVVEEEEILDQNLDDDEDVKLFQQ